MKFSFSGLASLVHKDCGGGIKGPRYNMWNKNDIMGNNVKVYAAVRPILREDGTLVS